MDTVFYVNEQALRAAEKKESLFDKFVEVFKENQAIILCGLLTMNGTANVYSLYSSLTK